MKIIAVTNINGGVAARRFLGCLRKFKPDTATIRARTMKAKTSSKKGEHFATGVG
jgi:hypothetical protein